MKEKKIKRGIRLDFSPQQIYKTTDESEIISIPLYKINKQLFSDKIKFGFLSSTINFKHLLHKRKKQKNSSFSSYSSDCLVFCSLGKSYPHRKLIACLELLFYKKGEY